jgi:hypothetical protein
MAIDHGRLIIEANQAAEVSQMTTQVAALETATHDAGSDTYVEQWARRDKKWARPDDHVLAPVAATPAPAVAVRSVSSWNDET